MNVLPFFKLLFLTVVLFTISCNSGNQKHGDQSNLDISSVSHEGTDRNISELEEATSGLDSLIAEGLVLADSTEECKSSHFPIEPRTKLVFDYPQGNKLILSEWQYDMRHVGLKLGDFIVYDCLTEDVLMESHYTIANYSVLEVTPSLSIQINADLPDENDRLRNQPFLIKTFVETDGSIRTINEVLFDVPSIDDSVLDSIETVYNSRPTLIIDDQSKADDFATDDLILDLFRGSINDNPRAKLIFLNLHDKYTTDGSLGELYNDLKSLLLEMD